MNTKTTTYKLFPKQFEFLFGYDKSKVNDIVALYGGVTCKKGSAEFLSPTGWRRIDTLTKEDLIGVYHPEDNTVRFEHPKEVFIYPADKWYEIDSKFVHQINCPVHKVYTIKNGKPTFQTMEEYYQEHINSYAGHTGKFITTFKVDGKPNDYTDDELRFIVAFQADGYLFNHYEKSKWNGAFHLKKRRKMARLIRLLRRLKYNFHYIQEKNGYFRVKVNAKYTYKKFPEEFYNILSSAQLKVIADEAPYWDGSREKTNNTYYSKFKENVDFIQFAAAAAGYSANIYTRDRSHEILNQGKIVDYTENRVKYSPYHTRPSLCAPCCTRQQKLDKIKILPAEEGELKYCPSTSTKLWLCREFGKISVSGNSGKTFIGSLKGLLMALKFPGIRGLVGAKSQDLLDNTTKRKYVEHLENMGMKEGVHWWYTDRKQAIVLKNGSVIRFKTLSDWETFMSEEFGFIEFEEASFLDEIIFDKLITRLRQSAKDGWEDFHRAMFLHTNPQGKRGWINKKFVDPKTKRPSYRFIRSSSRENLFLGPEYVEMLEANYSKEQIAEMIDGFDPTDDNTIAFPYFSTEKNVIEHIDYDPNYTLILTCDFNYNPMCWYLAQFIEGKWYILKELIQPNVITADMCKLILPVLESLNIRGRKFMICGDSHGRDKKTNGTDYGVMLGFFSNAGYSIETRVQKNNPLIKERLAVLRKFICNGKSERNFFVDSSCKWLLYNFDECKNDLANAGLKIPTDKEIQNDDNKRHLIHPIDAISYPMWFFETLQTAVDISEGSDKRRY